jgi:proteasome lid subunit RPN8/RPN11
MAALVFSYELRSRLERWAGSGYPLETCGLLIGRRGEDLTEVVDVTHARNIHNERAHDRFELAPEDLLHGDSTARAAGLDIVGVWHSHPDHPAFPSETDRSFAWEGWSYVIVSVLAGQPRELRSFRLRNGQFEEELVEP